MQLFRTITNLFSKIPREVKAAKYWILYTIPKKTSLNGRDFEWAQTRMDGFQMDAYIYRVT